MANLTSALKQLEQERNRLSSRLEQLNRAVSALTGASSTRTGKISSAGRARIAAANVLGGPKPEVRRSFRLLPGNVARCPQPQLLEFARRRRHAGRSGERLRKRCDRYCGSVESQPICHKAL